MWDYRVYRGTFQKDNKVEYLLQQPASLSDSAVNKLAAWIVLQAKTLPLPTGEWQKHNPNHAEETVSRKIETLQEKLFLLWQYHNTLLSKTIELISGSLSPESEEYDLNEKQMMLRIIESLFTKNVTSLRLDLRQFQTFHETFVSKSHLLSGLTHLRFKINWEEKKRINIDNLIIPFLSGLKGLKCLEIPNVGTNNILTCIENNCKLIEELNIYNSEDIDDNSMNILTRMHKLKSIDLQGTRVKQQGLETILLSCQNIEYIHFQSFDETYSSILNVLEKIMNSNNTQIFQLKNYSCSDFYLEKLPLLERSCPYIQTLSVNKIKQSFQTRLDFNLNYFTNLRKLTLRIIHMNHSDFKEGLQVIGRNLEYLCIVRAEDIDIYELMEMCPNLITLKLDECTFQNHSIGSRPNLSWTFNKLKKLSLDTSYYFDREYDAYFLGSVERVGSDVDVYERRMPADLLRNLTMFQEVSLFLLSNCLAVEYIQLSRSAWLTEELLLEALSANSLAHLIELRIRSFPSRCPIRAPLPVTAAVLDRLTRNCVNRPRVILEQCPSRD